MRIRTLQTEDARPLLAFELENRAWFDAYVEMRAPAFYTPAGIAAHIAEYLDTQRAGGMHPCVLLGDEGAIIGRANLRYISRYGGIAEVGYRIARQHTGQGLASAALAHLQQVAKADYGLHTLRAWVSDHNPGSQKVMEKRGFKRDSLAAHKLVRVGGADRVSRLYCCRL